MENPKIRSIMEGLLADATEAILTNGGEDPGAVQEGLEVLKKTFSKVGIPFNSTNLRIFSEGARCLFSCDTLQEQHLMLGSFAVFIRALKNQEVKEKKATKRTAPAKLENLKQQ